MSTKRTPVRPPGGKRITLAAVAAFREMQRLEDPATTANTTAGTATAKSGISSMISCATKRSCIRGIGRRAANG